MKTCIVTAKFLFLITAVGTSLSALAQSDIDLEDEDNRAGYAIGVNIGTNLMQQGITADVQVDAFMAGLSDALSDNVQMDEAAIMAEIQSFVQQQQDAVDRGDCLLVPDGSALIWTPGIKSQPAAAQKNLVGGPDPVRDSK